MTSISKSPIESLAHHRAAFLHSGQRLLSTCLRVSVVGLVLPRRERQQRDVARALDGRGQLPLVRRAYTGQPAGHDLAAFSDKLREQAHVFVIDVINLFHAELANLLASEKFSPALTPSRPAGTTVWTVGASRWTRWCRYFLNFVCH